MPSTKPTVFLLLVAVACTAAQTFYEVSVRDNNRQGGLQVNLPGASHRTFNPPQSQDNNGVPSYPKNLLPVNYGPQSTPNWNTQNYAPPKNNARPNQREFDTQSIQSNYPGQSNVRLSQEIGEDGSVRQTINHADPGNQAYFSSQQDNTARNGQQQPVKHQVQQVEDFEDTTTGYATRSNDKRDAGVWDTVPITYQGKKKVCFCPTRT